MIDCDSEKKLFEKELNILETAMAEIEAGGLTEGELLSNYKSLVMNYKKLLDLTRKIFRINDIQTKNLFRREKEIKNLLDNAGQGFLCFGKDLTVKSEYSAECIRIFGRRIGKANILSLLAGDDFQQNELLAGGLKAVWQTENETLQRLYLDKLPGLVKINESYLTIEYKLIPPDENGLETQIMLIITDVSDKYKAEEQVAYLSCHDKLTSLYNRAYIELWTSQMQTGENLPLSVIMADLNGLKLINDVFGHLQGDLLLVKLARVFLDCCRKKDIVARWGGDEFLILLPGTDENACAKVCRRIKAACGQVKDMPIELSVALGSATQHSPGSGISELFKIAEKVMYNNKLLESQKVRRKIIMSMEEILYDRCFEDRGHIERIKILAVNFAKYLGFKAKSVQMRNLNLLAALHDIGKVAIPGEILGKPGPLSAGEWEIMQGHSEIGFRMAQSIGETAVAEAILGLHERWDGQGYPLGLRGEEIPLPARLLAIVDVYDVITHDHPYRQAVSRKEALKEIEKGSGSQFDPELVRLFLDNANRLLQHF
ncbi:metal dependent phosphohydrolase [Desulfocucumis palustris]|uniref:Metal dependent phosphohydrolase n=1 Tax=Desulfocucumis palustris TaxID=1898651 RepID=A0A2L2XL06_9FIRM|nr:diguanylate cyclase [Desulfocucumis palustris]GBF34976.1 metal dependent phosphohydrolase [Desulfocucumis palustris]